MKGWLGQKEQREDGCGIRTGLIGLVESKEGGS